MYAIIKSGSKQYRVCPGDIIQVEKLEGDLHSTVKIDQVLLCSEPSEGGQSEIQLGQPTIPSAFAECEVVGQGRGDKILIFKKRRRQMYRRTQGHRQEYTQLLVTGLNNGSKSETLDAGRKKEILAKFNSQLTPKPEVRTSYNPKTLGSRKRLAEKQAQQA